jgi:Tfp pilus assembly protein PilE
MASVRTYLVGLIILAIVASVFAVLWLTTYFNYASYETNYENLQIQYNMLESNYTNLEHNYNSLQNQYQTLQTQYSSLQSQYSNLNNTYWNILTYLGQSNFSTTLQPGYFVYRAVVVPNGFYGTIYITASASIPVDVVVLDLYNLIQAAEGYPFQYYLYDQGTYINDNLSVGPGLYVVIVDNPSNTTATPLSFTVTTVYTPSS